MNKLVLKYDLVIFDLDGTIADTSPGILNSIRYTQKMMSLPEITLEQMYSHVGPPMEESYGKNFGLTGEALKQAVRFHKEYARQQGYREITLYDGLTDLLDYLKQNGCMVAVATLKAQETAEKIFTEYGLLSKLDLIAGTDIICPKTKSQLIEHCLSSLHIAKTAAVLIGDSSYDAIGAKEAGIDFLGVTYGFGFKCSSDVDRYPNIGCASKPSEIHNFI